MPTAISNVSAPQPRATPPPTKRPPRVLQVVRNTASALATLPVDWSQWYLTEEDDMGESMLHAKIRVFFEELLDRWLDGRGRGRAEVSGNVFFRWVEGEPNVQISPDAFVVDSVPEPMPECLETWRPGHLPPRFAVEIVSKDWRKDYDTNPPKYAHLGCKELVIYDPLHDVPRRHRERIALQVFRRTADGAFARVHAGAGPAYSAELGAWLVETGSGSMRRLRLARDEAGLDFVLAGTEVAVLERQETEVQRQVALQERQARLASDAENVLLREELARLRGK